MTVLAVVLAAGAGTRFAGGSKLTAPFRGSTVVGSAVGAALGAGLDETAIVTGAHSDLVTGHLPDSVTRLVNLRPADGLASSLRVGIDHARRRGHAAVVVGLGDQPLLEAPAWRIVADEVAPAGSEGGSGGSVSPIVFACYGDRRGHPVGLGAAVWPMLPSVGDSGASELARLRPDLVGEVPCPGNPVDIDTPADLARWSGSPGDREEDEGTWS